MVKTYIRRVTMVRKRPARYVARPVPEPAVKPKKSHA